jgi:hypothetical protein
MRFSCKVYVRVLIACRTGMVLVQCWPGLNKLQDTTLGEPRLCAAIGHTLAPSAAGIGARHRCCVARCTVAPSAQQSKASTACTAGCRDRCSCAKIPIHAHWVAMMQLLYLFPVSPCRAALPTQAAQPAWSSPQQLHSRRYPALHTAH